uniref:Golgin subfamily B member 1-like n=1 Tax=Angiostrongylus cantonensis TaxID=6313 RepID=A0A0K0DR07_ANGCA
MDELDSMQKEMAQLEFALQKAIVDKHEEVDVGLNLLHERENLRLKLSRLRANFLTGKVRVNQANQEGRWHLGLYNFTCDFCLITGLEKS